MELATEHDLRCDACELLHGLHGLHAASAAVCEKQTAVLVMAVGALHTLPLPGSNTVRWISFTDDIDQVQVPFVANLHN